LFQDELSKLGYIGEKTVRFEFRSDQGKLDRLPELATEAAELYAPQRPGVPPTGTWGD
jgi:hypothetical protein